MGNLKPLILRSINKLKAYQFLFLYVQNPKIKKIFIFLGFQINKRRNDKITYNQKKKKESKDVPAVAVKLPTFMFLKKKKFFFHNQKKKFKKKLLEIKNNKKRKFFKFH